MSVVNVLSIDAWADGADGWIWNNWHKVGSVDLDDVPTSDQGKIQWFHSQGYVTERALTECEIDDDGYNFVIVSRETWEPLYAIAYGEADV